MDVTKLKGEDLFFYLTEVQPDKKLANMVGLLEYALMYDKNKVYKMLEKITTNNKKIIAIYPGLGEKAPEGAEFIGSICDGGLYMI